MKFFLTILDALNHHATQSPNKIAFMWVDSHCKEENKMTFEQLQDQSNAVAARLIKLGCHKGDRVMVAYPFGLEFLAGMFGAMKLGIIPCSIYPPNPNQLNTEMPKFRRFAEDAGDKYALSTCAFATAMTAASLLYKTGVKWIGTDKLSIKKHNTNKPKHFEQFVGEPEAICFIQYTSGSTGQLKGVMVGHHHLLETCRAGISLTDLNTASVAALWVPQYHDMGLTGFMSCLYTGSQLVVASPLDFIAKPLLWTDMVEKYNATHTSAPNFAYALLLKRLEQANRKPHWSCMKAAMFGGEPAQCHVVEAVAKTLSIKPEQVYNIYGMAEMVVFVTGGAAKTDSEEGLVSCGIVDSPSLKIRIVDDGNEVEDGQVGSIWAQSPRVAAGYYGQSELTTATFANALPGYDGTWLDTGDLGKIVDGKLYVTGRVKDVIIINGKNYYPTDVEPSIDETFGDIIRPGRTTAFQDGEDSIGITVEGRKEFDKSENEDLAVQIANHVSQVQGLFASEVVVLKLGVTPKTTSGKLKRSEIRQTTIAGGWKEPSVLLQFKRQEALTPFQKSQSPSFLERSFSIRGIGSSEFYLNEETKHDIMRKSMSTENWNFEELPDIDLNKTNSLPSKAVEAVHAIECNPSKLDEYFSELHLSGVSCIDEAWSKAIKTTAAMQTMCSQITKHLVDKHPTICQLAESLSENPDWLLIDDRTDYLLQLVHQIFVLQWVTTFMMDDAECMQQKLQNDAEWEAMSKNKKPVPLELQEMLDLPEQDPLYGNLPFFGWIKNRSQGPPPSSTWNDLYIAWNMHFVFWSGDKHSSIWKASKLLLPCIIGDDNAGFLHARATSLYLVVQTIGRKTESPKYYTESFLSRNALEDFGMMNLSWAQKLGYTHPPLRSNKGMALNEEDWLPRFDQWGRDYLKTQAINPNPDIKASITGAAATDPDDFSMRYASVIKTVLGSEVDTSKTWAENGLTSLKSAELRNMVEEQLHVVLPTNFEHLYPTLSELSVFLRASEGKSFPKQNTDNHPNFLWGSSRSRISKLQMGVIQTLGSSVILLLVLVSLVPSYFLVLWVMEQCSSTNGVENHCSISWVFLPITFPLFLLSLSVVVVICKVAVVGKYRHQQFDLLSWDYVRWWFVDRLLHIWESIAGQFLVETRFIWIFYWLLGADLAGSAKIQSYIREFDLVKVGSNATIGHPIRCRKFSQSSDAGPKLTFRPIVIGNNCQVSGMVSPGGEIGEGSKVEKLSVVEEGAMVPHGVLAKGNPACHAGSFQPTNSKSLEEPMLDVFKILWTIFEAYHFFTLSFLVHTALNVILPSWRYVGILHWILLFPLTSFLALMTSIGLKWLLIGKRDPSDEYEGSLWRGATNWACDFHFRTACWSFIPFFGQSRIWNMILFLHGLDIDMASTLSGPYFVFLPSKVDFVKIRGSFVATMSLDFSKQGNSKIDIINSSIGYGSNLHAGVKIIQSTIPPRSDVTESIYNLNQVGKSKRRPMLTEEVALQFMNVVVFASIIPSYEIGLAATTGSSPVVIAFGLALAVLLQLFIWILSTRVVELILLHLPAQAHEKLYGVYLTHVWYFRVGNWLEMLLYGTPMFGYYARFMGAEVEGDLWYFGNTIYEYGYLHFKERTIVDDSHVSGHYLDGNGLTLGDTYVSGLLHPGCYARAGSVVSGDVNGPWKVFLSNDGKNSTSPV
ncbi:D-alanine--D-alanyl carrier protein ligase [Seminavis robusta]|uniref:D-alanine--D-alanyl carrier protein ligase n=1 Tax=Seminavis robusta TaxID=568900 RepID=A0A9N8I177_9STRA|nr:D-alanine--D-alanyl carrier protein ligase [Seminavis robusta]|eukprot:Sro3212_g345340.1 D-alanine--D-alanyl carrier protein ligase (1680) ;mRNA; f:1931-7338